MAPALPPTGASASPASPRADGHRGGFGVAFFAVKGLRLLVEPHATLRELLPVLHAHASTQLHWPQRRHRSCCDTPADEGLSVSPAAVRMPDEGGSWSAAGPPTGGGAWTVVASVDLRVFVGGAPG